ncbi:hypothetical protein [Stygiobacter electus]|uniref:Pentapeptide MXKDX repeat protein n=1 Tax=Stygiobacter electus TaxID=3032292 RepID=A0AAE3TEG9_9BACT|nr:hypothetical protein [Stygiobacter electus]MDF1612273.1 hypothetical protein [Stygiobacter electus]
MFLVLMFLISVPALAQGKYDSTEAKHKTMKHDHKMKHGMKDSAHQLTIKNKKK